MPSSQRHAKIRNQQKEPACYLAACAGRETVTEDICMVWEAILLMCVPHCCRVDEAPVLDKVTTEQKLHSLSLFRLPDQAPTWESGTVGSCGSWEWCGGAVMSDLKVLFLQAKP
jgi:hypothetical protein